MDLATSLRPFWLTVSALASSTSGLPMPVLSTFPSPATHRPDDHLQPVPVGNPHGYCRRWTPVGVAVAMCFLLRPNGHDRRANTVGIRERSAAFPPSLIKARWHTRLSFKPVGYPVSVDRAVQTCRSIRRGGRAVHCPDPLTTTCDLHPSAKHSHARSEGGGTAA